MWNIAKPFLEEETKRKIKILGSKLFDAGLENVSPQKTQLPLDVCLPRMSFSFSLSLMIFTEKYKEEILQYIDPDQLPVHWGGNCRDPDGNEYCQSKVTQAHMQTHARTHTHARTRQSTRQTASQSYAFACLSHLKQNSVAYMRSM